MELIKSRRFEVQLVPPASRQSAKERALDLSLHFIKPKSGPGLVYRTLPHMIDSVLEMTPDLSAAEVREIA